MCEHGVCSVQRGSFFGVASAVSSSEDLFMLVCGSMARASQLQLIRIRRASADPSETPDAHVSGEKQVLEVR